MSHTYVAHLGCPTCGATLRHEAAGRPTDAGLRATAVCYCSRCRRRWQIVLELHPFAGVSDLPEAVAS